MRSRQCENTVRLGHNAPAADGDVVVYDAFDNDSNANLRSLSEKLPGADDGCNSNLYGWLSRYAREY